MALTIDPLSRKSKTAISTEGRVIRTHTEKYRISSPTQINQFQAQVQFAAQMNYLAFAICSYDPVAALRNLEVETEEKTRDPWRFLANVEFSTETPSIQKSEDPLNDPVEIESETKEEKRAILYDLDNKPMRNLASDWYDPPIELPVSNVVLRFVRNDPTFTPNLQYQLVDHVNESPIFGADNGELKCTKASQKQMSRNQRIYFQTTFEFEHSRFGWQPKPLEQGRRMILAGKLSDILDPKTRSPVTDPRPLYRVTAADVDLTYFPVPSSVSGGFVALNTGLSTEPQADDVIPIPPELVVDLAKFTDFRAIPTAEFNDLNLPYAQV